MPTTVAERLKAIQDRNWAMHDALLTIRLPFETFYNSLTNELRQRLRRGELELAGIAAGKRAARASAARMTEGIPSKTERALPSLAGASHQPGGTPISELRPRACPS